MPIQSLTLSHAAHAEFSRLLDRRAVRTVFQPIIDLDNGDIVAFEALTRGPEHSVFADPAVLFDEAYRADRAVELDWVCRTAAMAEAMAAGLPPSVPLFVNVEPLSFGSTCPSDLTDIIERARHELRILFEVTERSLAGDTAGLLNAVARARTQSTGVALDDVGADPTSLAMMPLVRPDVIKLDLSLVQGWPTLRRARIINAVQSEVERSGAVVVAEGIETAYHADVARAMGASLGQGWYFAPPGRLPDWIAEPRRPIALPTPAPVVPGTPFDIVARRCSSRPSTKDLISLMSRDLEYLGLDSSEPAVFLACFQHVRHFGKPTRLRFSRLASRAALTAVLGEDMPAQPGPGIRGGLLAKDDPLVGQWVVVVLGPHVSGALVARDRGDTGPERDRSFDLTVTHDRDLVIEAAQPILMRLQPLR
jgi:EAL domain-containing protein (putative c-di-GMP-specific phosphodiesterase class I)